MKLSFQEHGIRAFHGLTATTNCEPSVWMSNKRGGDSDDRTNEGRPLTEQQDKRLGSIIIVFEDKLLLLKEESQAMNAVDGNYSGSLFSCLSQVNKRNESCSAHDRSRKSPNASQDRRRWIRLRIWQLEKLFYIILRGPHQTLQSGFACLLLLTEWTILILIIYLYNTV